MSSARTDRTGPSRPVTDRGRTAPDRRSEADRRVERAVVTEHAVRARIASAARRGSTREPAPTGTGPARPTARPWARAAADVRMAVSHAVGAVAVGLLVCVGLVVLGWAGDAASGTDWTQAVRLGGAVWLLAHLGELAVVSEVVTSPVDPPTEVPGTVSLAPLGLVLLAAALPWRVGSRIARRCAAVRSLLLCLPVAAVVAATAWVVAVLAGTEAVTPRPAACALGAAALALVACLAGVLRVHARTLAGRLPHPVAVRLGRVVPAAGVAVTAWLLTGAVLLSVQLLLDLPTVAGLHDALAPGAVGGVLLLLGQVAALPTAVVWAATVVAGPGVRLGTGHVGPSGSTVVDVPAVPLLAALPDPGPLPLWAWLAPLAVVLAGALAGWHAHRSPSARGASLLDRGVDAVVVALLAGAAAAGLVVATAGALGPWQPLGPDLLLVVAVVAAEVLVGALLAGGALHLLAGRPITGRVSGTVPSPRRWRLPGR